MSALDLEDLRNEYLSRVESYRILEQRIREKIEKNISKLDAKFDVLSRIKDVDSFIKKSIRKKYSVPLTEIKDQLGFRIITIYENDLAKINNFIHEEFIVHHSENKLDSLEYNQLGYLGLHFEVALRERVNEVESFYNELTFEIQVHTKAQSLWASVSHELSYKPPFGDPPAAIQRSIYRLVALIEIFDKEVGNAKDTILSQSDFPEAKLLVCLEGFFRSFSSKAYDKEFSIQNLSRLKDLLKEAEIKDFELRIADFIENNSDKLDRIFSDYSSDSRDAYKMLMLFQPESLLVFERLEKDKFSLLDLWKNFLPLELLHFLANIWGITLPDST